MGDYFKDTHTHACMHIKLYYLYEWTYTSKSIKVNTYAETIGLGNMFYKKRAQFHVRQNHIA
jgi:hypothetical protein